MFDYDRNVENAYADGFGAGMLFAFGLVLAWKCYTCIKKAIEDEDEKDEDEKEKD